MSADLDFKNDDHNLLVGLQQSVSSQSLLPDAFCNRALELDIEFREGCMDSEKTLKLARAAKLTVNSDVYWLFLRNAADSRDSRMVDAIVDYLTGPTVVGWILKKSVLSHVPINIFFLVLMELRNGKTLKEDPATQYQAVMEGLFLPLFPYMVRQASLQGSE